MRIDKITFKDNQAWIVVKGEDGEYLGTWHTTNPEFVEQLRKENPKFIKFGDYLIKKTELTDEEKEEFNTNCRYCGLPMVEHEDEFCPSGTEEFGGRR